MSHVEMHSAHTSGISFNLFAGLLFVTSSCANVQINDFISPPTTVKARENNTVLLPCYLNTLSNDEAYAIAVKWYKNDDLLADSANETLPLPERYTLWNNGSLEIVTVQPSDTGEYTCEIERPDPWGTVKQRHAIEVLHSPSVEPFPPTGFLQVKLGEEVRMSCNGGGVPYPIITWSSKGEELKLLDHREILKFTASDWHLAGIYECTAVNGVGEPAKAQIELNIIYPPELTTLRSWIHTAPGHRAQLDCRISADPQATVTWLKGEVPVPLDSRIVSLIDGDKYTLLIRNVQRSDFGIYTCRAINELGQGELHIQVSGVPNPGVFKRSDERNMNAKNFYTLIWEVDSYTPIIEYNLLFRPYKPRSGVNKPNWTKLTIPTEHSSGPVYSKAYTIRGLQEKTVYETLLVSRNRYGWSKPSPILRFATAGAERCGLCGERGNHNKQELNCGVGNREGSVFSVLLRSSYARVHAFTDIMSHSHLFPKSELEEEMMTTVQISIQETEEIIPSVIGSAAKRFNCSILIYTSVIINILLCIFCNS